MLEVVRFTGWKANEWNEFVAGAKNATFLFNRSYMDYHADRFEDCSLMLYEGHRLSALLPANRVGQTLCSHQGLTYGGLVIDSKATAESVCDMFEAVNGFLRADGFCRVVYKAFPSVYSVLPSEEPLYALTMCCHARLISRDVSSVVRLDRRIGFSELRRRGVKKALKNGVSIRFTDDLETFWRVLTDNLHSKYHARPVHTLQEIRLLKSRFPDNISLCAAYEGQTMLGGTLLYMTPQVVKTQYISATERGKELGALDLLFKTLIDDSSFSQLYFDMGTSALEHSNELRRPLIFQKEGFGARAVCCDTYEWTL